MLELPSMPTHGRVARGADAVPPPTTSLELRPATREVIDRVVDIRTNGGDIDFPLKVAGNAPASGRVVHSYARGTRVEPTVGDWGRKSSYRGLFGLGGTRLSFGRDRRRDVLYYFVFLRGRGLRWRSSNWVLPGREGLGLGFGRTRRSRSRRSFRHAWLPWLGRNGRRSLGLSVGLVRSACCFALADRERSRAEDPLAWEVPVEACGSAWAAAASRSSSA